MKERADKYLLSSYKLKQKCLGLYEESSGYSYNKRRKKMKQVKKLLGKDMVVYNKNKIERRYTKADTEKQYDLIVDIFNQNCNCRLKPWNEVEVWNPVHFLIYLNIFFDKVLKDKTRPIKHSFKCLGVIQEYAKYLNSGFF